MRYFPHKVEKWSNFTSKAKPSSEIQLSTEKHVSPSGEQSFFIKLHSMVYFLKYTKNYDQQQNH